MAHKVWQVLLLQSALETEMQEIDCTECNDLLDQYTDFILSSGDPGDIMPKVRQHLKQCQCCSEGLEAMLIMIRGTTSNL